MMGGKVASGWRCPPYAIAVTESDDEENPTRAYAAKRGQKDRSEDVEFRLLDPSAPDMAVEYSFRRRTI
jgi:hypothetical protein